MIARGSKVLQEVRDEYKEESSGAEANAFVLVSELDSTRVGGVLFEAISWPLLATLSVLLERLGGAD